VTKIVDKWLPLPWIYVLSSQNQIGVNVYPEDTYLNSGSTTQLFQPVITIKHMNATDGGLQLDGDSNTRGAPTQSLARGLNDAAANLSGSKRNLEAFAGGTGFFPVRGARRSTALHISGDGKFTTQAGRSRKLSKVCVPDSIPKVIVQPSTQKEEIGARLGVPSELRELTIATGVPKYKILGAIVSKQGCLRSLGCVVNMTFTVNAPRARTSQARLKHYEKGSNSREMQEISQVSATLGG
jgi:hypothetical protein